MGLYNTNSYTICIRVGCWRKTNLLNYMHQCFHQSLPWQHMIMQLPLQWWCVLSDIVNNCAMNVYCKSWVAHIVFNGRRKWKWTPCIPSSFTASKQKSYCHSSAVLLRKWWTIHTQYTQCGHGKQMCNLYIHLVHNTHNTASILHSLPKTILAEEQNLKVAPFPSAFTASKQKSYFHSSAVLLRKWWTTHTQYTQCGHGKQMCNLYIHLVHNTHNTLNVVMENNSTKKQDSSTQHKRHAL